jgi:predicted nucleic acid-binding protein
MIIIDTSVWIDYLGGFETPQTLWLDAALETQPLGLTDWIMGEILQGIRDEAQFNAVHNELMNFEIFEMGGLEIAAQAARNHRKLRSLGYTVPRTIDCWIATFCIENGHTLLHNDHDFEPFKKELGLQAVV